MLGSSYKMSMSINKTPVQSLQADQSLYNRKGV